jgi:DNA repair exonuclease SbcCD ATPase subunit
VVINYKINIMKAGWNKIKNAVTFTTRTQVLARHERWVILRAKDYSTSEKVARWLELAKEIVDQNLDEIRELVINRSSCHNQIEQLKKNLTDSAKQKEVRKQIDYLQKRADNQTVDALESVFENDFFIEELTNLEKQTNLTQQIKIEIKNLQDKLAKLSLNKNIIQELNEDLRQQGIRDTAERRKNFVPVTDDDYLEECLTLASNPKEQEWIKKFWWPEEGLDWKRVKFPLDGIKNQLTVALKYKRIEDNKPKEEDIAEKLRKFEQKFNNKLEIMEQELAEKDEENKELRELINQRISNQNITESSSSETAQKATESAKQVSYKRPVEEKETRVCEVCGWEHTLPKSKWLLAMGLRKPYTYAPYFDYHKKWLSENTWYYVCTNCQTKVKFPIPKKEEGIKMQMNFDQSRALLALPQENWLAMVENLKKK